MKLNRIFSIVLALLLVPALAASSHPTRQPQAVKALGSLIRQAQTDRVQPGGNEANPVVSWVDKQSFDQSNDLQSIVQAVKGNPIFRKGVAALRSMPRAARRRALESYEQPVYPTWAMNGHIGNDGTTDAGYEMEEEIADALTRAVKRAL